MHPSFATATKWTAFLPRQVQRTMAPLAGIIMLVMCFISNFGPFDATSAEQYHWSNHEPEKFPRRIWQSWKVNPYAFDDRDHMVAQTWPQKNPSFRYEVLTDYNDLYYVESHFGPAGLNRPDIVHTYRSLTAKIIKADLLRYLIMYVEGGVYADIDVEALRPVERFIPSRFEEKDIDMVIGIEIDQPEFKDHAILGPKSMSFCQWTFMSKPRIPVMMQLVDHIIAWINDVAKQQGPSAFTRAILKYMSQQVGHQVSWDTFHAMDESRVVGRVLVLTVEAFAAGQGHSDSGNHNAKQALVKHHYHASKWPTNHPRYKHPVYGEVESCNWVAECVQAWDENKAAFELLPLEEQQRQLATKEAADAAQEMFTVQGGLDLLGLPMSPGEPGIDFTPPQGLQLL
ncbi:hypothetical protein LTR70_001526 [Exophiala xenobiotica]|uniref:Initiation-specific alpha-1,6-mannosyltransferase n=1 Tax=Lithohypha guttulata TaxID=1690604 RepID=A0ABR0K7H3_9EURO|nr:hypothetical protein LTR24_005954 [Lithohypha guttulata]KAK5327903.1 hypothetical protein LTR70_001526 [Exophiala xenobiotica]